ncbi:MAG: hypothetical protein IKK21_01480 [Clostridia bacterium]|nr:hypothetical protein [Clostridia bacterium]
MKKLFAIVLTLCLMLSCACAEDALQITKETYLPIELYEDSNYVFMFTEVTNTGDTPIALDSAEVTMLSADNEEVDTFRLYNASPWYLAPGESAWIYGDDYLEDTALDAVPGHKLNLEYEDAEGYDAMFRMPIAGEAELVSEYGEDVWRVTLTITNTTEETIFSSYVAYALYDAAGNLLYVADEGLEAFGLLPGQSFLMRADVEAAFTAYWADHAIVPATVQAYVFIAEH